MKAACAADWDGYPVAPSILESIQFVTRQRSGSAEDARRVWRTAESIVDARQKNDAAGADKRQFCLSFTCITEGG
ncbi:MAG TPA: hypothetical protein DDX19_04875 [Rhodopirellula baltica]|uniref:Uncharacterized protein n=1 Tax=Rhodopirellula baltica (strain DSM 10527 / NCIMB 13988 / SH1) TaxID=243090 RepID=Q7USZ1_RHOBA|nr:hypothetical protein RB4219 [Rhodopirellula baltica SH 1]HBE62096.1 hypothetical protein [Rhodopirellula baltica]